MTLLQGRAAPPAMAAPTRRRLGADAGRLALDWLLAARRAWPPLALVLAILVAWQLVVKLFGISELVLPAPTAVLDNLVTNVALLIDNGAITASAACMAFGLSVAIGVPIGVLSVKSRLFAHTVYPFIVGSQAVPKLALTPLFAVWLGFGITSKVAIAFLIAFFPVAIATVVGLGAVDSDMRQLARVLGLGRVRTFLRIELPAALPSIFGGLKVAVGFSVIGAVVGELVGADEGLGRLTMTAGTTLNTPLLVAALFSLGVLGLTSYGLLVAVERLLIPWRERRDLIGKVSA